jgi:hypothetical protein
VNLVLDGRDHVTAQGQLRAAPEQGRPREGGLGTRERFEPRLQRLEQGIHDGAESLARALTRARGRFRWHALVVAVIERQGSPERQDQLLLHPSAPHRQVAMGALRLAQLGHTLLIREVVLEAAVLAAVVAVAAVLALAGLGLGPARAHEALVEIGRPDQLSQAHILGDALDEDLRGPFQGRRHIGDARFTTTERERTGLGSLGGRWLGGAVPTFPQPGRERLEAHLARQGGLGLTLLLVRKIEILEDGQIEGPEELLLEGWRQLLLTLDLLDDELLPGHDLVP